MCTYTQAMCTYKSEIKVIDRRCGAKWVARRYGTRIGNKGLGQRCALTMRENIFLVEAMTPILCIPSAAGRYGPRVGARREGQE